MNNGLLADKGRLEITFPDQVAITASAPCLAYEETTTILLSCEASGTGETPQRVTVTHSFTSKDSRGESIIVKLQNSVRNPPSTMQSNPFFLQTTLYDDAQGKYFLVDVLNEDNITVTANAPNSFHAITITRSEEEVSSLTDLQFCITPSNPVPASSKLTIAYPED